MTDDAPAEPTTPTPQGSFNPVPGDWRRVSPKYLTVDLVSNLVWGVLFTAAGLVPVLLLRWDAWWWTLPIALAVLTIIEVALTPRRVRSIGYRLRDDDLVFRKGIMFQRIVAVPFGRMQLVDINRGPLARALGLAELKLVTAAAATGVTIPGLPIEEAEQLRDHLVAVAETRRAGL